MFKVKKFIHIHFSEKDGVNPIFYLFPLKTFQIVHIAIGLTQELTMYVIQSYAGGKMMGSLRLHIENKNRNQELRNICLYSIAKTVSLFGSSIYSFALGLYVLQITGSALNFAITLILGTIPMIVMNPFAGVIADKVDKKKLVVCMDVLSGCLLITVYILSNYYGLNLFIIYTTTFLMTVFTTCFGIGLEAVKPNMVTKERLMSINSISKIIDSISLILGGNKILYHISSMPFIRRKNDRFRQYSISYEFYSYFCQKYVGNVLSRLYICAILFPVSDFK